MTTEQPFIIITAKGVDFVVKLNDNVELKGDNVFYNSGFPLYGDPIVFKRDGTPYIMMSKDEYVVMPIGEIIGQYDSETNSIGFTPEYKERIETKAD